ncbi:hypothetical protein HT102_08270 [Hoyosella sp. G463]|uniref:Uncharacterized protein n=1 Tax=Lolliginicoccus lacisalsi TaxID=2742202 RepID=A0A927JD70_9ACTN|nr:hypothetical protein [Lolliginicoccus lacisalsi]MBD8506477.1 hypothetical protein [Lolliginicoccus lacisalsi]
MGASPLEVPGLGVGATVQHVPAPDMPAPATPGLGPVARAHGVSPSARRLALLREQVPGMAEQGTLPVPAPLREAIPGGGLAHGTACLFSGTPLVLMGVLAEVTRAGGHAALLGLPELGLVAAAEMGADLRRIALVPHPGQDPAQIISVLLEGMDLVVIGPGSQGVAPARARAINARLRGKKTVLAVLGTEWPGARTTIAGHVRRYAGVSRGRGRLRSHELLITVQGRGSPPSSVPACLSAAARGTAQDRLVRWDSADE